MMIQTLLTTLLLTARITAQVISVESIPADIQTDIADRSRSENIEDILRSYIDSLDDNTNNLYRRQSTSAPTNSDNPTTNSSTWDSITLSACTAALEMLRGLASSPSGMAFCYNLPSLDNSTGVFQADLRLFTISSPTGDFANVLPKDVAVGVQYVGATVQAISPTELKTRGLEGRKFPLASPPAKRKGKRDAGRSQRRRRKNAAPVLAQSYAFVGQINRNALTANLNS
jgi:hypothetical protein